MTDWSDAANTTVEDISIYKQFTKLQLVMDLDRQIKETINTIHLVKNDVDPRDVSSAFRKQLVMLLIELEPQLKRHREHVKKEGNYWDGPLDIGTVSIPEDAITSNVKKEDLHLTGLKSLVELPDPIYILRSVKTKEIGLPTRSVTVKEELPIPFEILLKSYRYLVDWSSQVGLGISLFTEEYYKI